MSKRSKIIIFFCSIFLVYLAITIAIFHFRLPDITTHYALPDVDTDGGLWYQWFNIFINREDMLFDVSNYVGYPFGFNTTSAPLFNLIYFF